MYIYSLNALCQIPEYIVPITISEMCLSSNETTTLIE